ncbi:MAG: rhomboid family intramembrane serine protease [Desulforhopalus sp.]
MSKERKNNSQLCPGCRKLISRSVPTCPFCGLKNPSSRLKNNFLMAGFRDPNSLVTTLIFVNAVMFILSIAINPKSASMHFNPFNFLSPSNQSLLVLGSTGTIPIFHFHRWWSLISANYLHGSLLHIVFNMIALRQLAPLVIQEFGVNRMVILYTLGGVGGFFISTFAGVRFTIGASASLCSLIGALLYYGKSRGGIYGQNVFSQIGGWALSIAIFGFLVPGINNWGHGGGMVCGVLLAALLGYQDRKKENFAHKVLAASCLAITVVVLVWSCFNGAAFLILSK